MNAYREYAEFSEALSRKAGVIMQSARSGRLKVRWKPNGTPETDIDLDIQQLAIDEIQLHFPGHTIIGEEGSFGPPDAEHIWRVDPLDGTGEYVEGGDPDNLTYGFGIAKQYRGVLEMGAFYNPSRDEMYTAMRGLGAYLNRSPIHVGSFLLEPGIPYDFTHWESEIGDAHPLERKLGPSLGQYSAIYQGCMVASGKSAFAVFLGRTAHDIAPAAIMVAEAQGTVSDIYGDMHDWRGDLSGAVYSNGVVHSGVLETIIRY